MADGQLLTSIALNSPASRRVSEIFTFLFSKQAIMSIRLLPLALVVAMLILGLHADYDKLQFKDCGSKGTVIKQTDLTPMPVLNPGNAYLTFVATLNRPVSKFCERSRSRRRVLLRWGLSRNVGNEIRHYPQGFGYCSSSAMLLGERQFSRLVYVPEFV